MSSQSHDIGTRKRKAYGVGNSRGAAARRRARRAAYAAAFHKRQAQLDRAALIAESAAIEARARAEHNAQRDTAESTTPGRR